MALDLKPHQAADICGLWKELQGKVSELFEKRVKIHKGLASMSHSGRCGREFAEEYLKVSCWAVRPCVPKTAYSCSFSIDKSNSCLSVKLP